MSLRLQDISLPLATFTLDVNATLNGNVTAVFGPSGAGKTSLLDLVAGLRRAPSAFIQFDDEILTDTKHNIFVPSRRRRFGYVPQDALLFPHLSVRRNLLYGHRPAASSDNSFGFDHIVAVLELEPLLTRDVDALSGGEKQRVALARALLSSPRLLLLDEPLASLDVRLKTKILPYLTRIRDEFQVPMLYVTHDRFEALTMADDMMVIVDGRVQQFGPVRDVFRQPANVAVAELLKVETIQTGSILERRDGLMTVAVGSARLTASEQNLPPHAREALVCIRAEDIILSRGQDVPSSARNHLPANVVSLSPDGPMIRVDLDAGFPLAALLTKQACADLQLERGSKVTALVKAPHVHLIPRGG